MEFPISKKLFHLVVNPGTSRCPTVDLELVQTTRNIDFQLFLGIFQGDEPTKRVPFTAELEIPEILTKWKAPFESCNRVNVYTAVRIIIFFYEIDNLQLTVKN